MDTKVLTLAEGSMRVVARLTAHPTLTFFAIVWAVVVLWYMIPYFTSPIRSRRGPFLACWSTPLTIKYGEH